MPSIELIILNVFFSAVVTARLIQHHIKVITFHRGVLSTRWNPDKPYVLVRLSNFHNAELVNVVVSIVLTVEETRMANGQSDAFLC